MAYEKNTWNDGDVITAELLNHIEDGIENAGGSGGGFVVTVTGEEGSYTADKTLAEITTAIRNGQIPTLIDDEYCYQLDLFRDSLVSFTRFSVRETIPDDQDGSVTQITWTVTADEVYRAQQTYS